MFDKFLLACLTLLIAGCTASSKADMPPLSAWPEQCKDWDQWDKPAPPFKVHGNTYHVGTCGISAIFIADENGHVLIDSADVGGAEVVLANIESIGFAPSDISILLNSHEHFDHVGGMARIIEATGADLFSSAIGVEVMRTGRVHPEDPQFTIHDPMEPTNWGIAYHSGQPRHILERLGLTPIDTPGHTPGAMSWQWESCEGDDCKTIVYADSLSPVSADGYRFSDHPEYLAQFRASIAAIAELDCDILLTPHPSASFMRAKLLAGDIAGEPTCRAYAANTERRLNARLEKEAEEAGQ